MTGHRRDWDLNHASATLSSLGSSSFTEASSSLEPALKKAKRSEFETSRGLGSSYDSVKPIQDASLSSLSSSLPKIPTLPDETLRPNLQPTNTERRIPPQPSRKVSPTVAHTQYQPVLQSDQQKHGPKITNLDPMEIPAQQRLSPFICPICQLGFATNFTVKRHMKIHTRRPGNVQEFKCNICDRSYTESGNLARHKRKIHGTSSSQSGGSNTQEEIRAAEASWEAQRIKDRSREGKLQIELGRALCQLGQFNKALTHQREALDIAVKINSRDGEFMAHELLGVIQEGLGQDLEAVASFKTALAIARDLQNARWLASVQSRLASLLQNLGELDEALQVAREAATNHRACKDKDGEMGALCIMAVICNGQKRFEEALPLFEAVCAHVFSEEDHAMHVKPMVLGGMAIALTNLGQYERALNCHEQSLSLALQTRDKSSQAISYVNMGATYHIMQMYPEAVHYYQIAGEIWLELGDVALLRTVNSNLSMAHREMGHLSEANHFQRLAKTSPHGRAEEPSWNQATHPEPIAVSYHSSSSSAHPKLSTSGFHTPSQAHQVLRPNPVRIATTGGLHSAPATQSLQTRAGLHSAPPSQAIQTQATLHQAAPAQGMQQAQAVQEREQ